MGGCWTEQPSPECSLLPVQVPSSDFYKIVFSKEVQVPPMVLSSHSRCMILTWGQSFDPLFPTSKADMWSSWVGRVLHTLVTYIAEPNGDP